MIKDITFVNYKCLSGKEFALQPLNIFTGYNGRGKSSVIQALLMLAQSVNNEDLNSIQQLHVNGKFVKLGDFDELLYDTDIYTLEFDMNIQDAELKNHSVRLGYEMSDDYKVGKLIKCEVDGEDYFSSISSYLDIKEQDGDKTLRQLPRYIHDQFMPQNIHYVSANRMGPVSFVERKEVPEYHSVGANGDMTINTLHTYKGKIDKRMNVSVSDENEYDLLPLVDKWLNYIMDGDNGEVNIDDGTIGEKKKRSSVLRLDFVLNNKALRAYNVGFGYSYILSILVTALIAREGNVVVVENPEAHLHPEAQFRLTQLLAKLASRGVQVFVETHSEHVVNAVRLAVIEEEYAITNNQVGLFFFDNNYEKIDLHIERNGRINNWPTHFFDQYSRELAEIGLKGSKIK